MSSSSSSSTSSSHSPFPSHLLNIPIHRTMEQVWNDIHLSSRPLLNQNQNPSGQDPDFRSMQVFADFLTRPFSKDNPPATTLSANSDPLRPISHITTQLFETSSGKKRFQEFESSTCGDTDRRHKRMMKNRESAARSRARKQAYTNELELEAAHLMEENARLRRQQEELCVATPAQLPKKHTLHRTSTAPF